MDNLGSHKGKAVRHAIRAVGARLLFLPRYSPDLNPIEQVCAKLRHLLRQAAERSVRPPESASLAPQRLPRPKAPATPATAAMPIPEQDGV